MKRSGLTTEIGKQLKQKLVIIADFALVILVA